MKKRRQILIAAMMMFGSVLSCVQFASAEEPAECAPLDETVCPTGQGCQDGFCIPRCQQNGIDVCSEGTSCLGGFCQKMCIPIDYRCNKRLLRCRAVLEQIGIQEGCLAGERCNTNGICQASDGSAVKAYVEDTHLSLGINSLIPIYPGQKEVKVVFGLNGIVPEQGLWYLIDRDDGLHHLEHPYTVVRWTPDTNQIVLSIPVGRASPLYADPQTVGIRIETSATDLSFSMEPAKLTGRYSGLLKHTTLYTEDEVSVELLTADDVRLDDANEIWLWVKPAAGSALDKVIATEYGTKRDYFVAMERVPVDNPNHVRRLVGSIQYNHVLGTVVPSVYANAEGDSVVRELGFELVQTFDEMVNGQFRLVVDENWKALHRNEIDFRGQLTGILNYQSKITYPIHDKTPTVEPYQPLPMSVRSHFNEEGSCSTHFSLRRTDGSSFGDTPDIPCGFGAQFENGEISLLDDSVAENLLTTNNGHCAELRLDAHESVGECYEKIADVVGDGPCYTHLDATVQIDDLLDFAEECTLTHNCGNWGASCIRELYNPDVVSKLGHSADAYRFLRATRDLMLGRLYIFREAKAEFIHAWYRDPNACSTSFYDYCDRDVTIPFRQTNALLDAYEDRVLAPLEDALRLFSDPTTQYWLDSLSHNDIARIDLAKTASQVWWNYAEALREGLERANRMLAHPAKREPVRHRFANRLRDIRLALQELSELENCPDSLIQNYDVECVLEPSYIESYKAVTQSLASLAKPYATVYNNPPPCVGNFSTNILLTDSANYIRRAEQASMVLAQTARSYMYNTHELSEDIQNLKEQLWQLCGDDVDTVVTGAECSNIDANPDNTGTLAQQRLIAREAIEKTFVREQEVDRVTTEIDILHTQIARQKALNAGLAQAFETYQTNYQKYLEKAYNTRNRQIFDHLTDPSADQTAIAWARTDYWNNLASQLTADLSVFQNLAQDVEALLRLTDTLFIKLKDLIVTQSWQDVAMIEQARASLSIRQKEKEAVLLSRRIDRLVKRYSPGVSGWNADSLRDPGLDSHASTMNKWFVRAQRALFQTLARLEYQGATELVELRKQLVGARTYEQLDDILYYLHTLSQKRICSIFGTDGPSQNTGTLIIDIKEDILGLGKTDDERFRQILSGWTLIPEERSSLGLDNTLGTLAVVFDLDYNIFPVSFCNVRIEAIKTELVFHGQAKENSSWVNIWYGSDGRINSCTLRKNDPLATDQSWPVSYSTLDTNYHHFLSVFEIPVSGESEWKVSWEALPLFSRFTVLIDPLSPQNFGIDFSDLANIKLHFNYSYFEDIGPAESCNI